jgi:hypothetical protein
MFKKILRIILFTLLGIFTLLAAILLVLIITRPENFRIQLPVEHKDAFMVPAGNSYPLALHVEGNHLVDSNGDSVRLRGVMIPDPYRLEGEKRFNADLIAEIQATGANVIRVPVHPENWQNDEDYLWRYLDPLVSWAGDAGLYVIIDLHFLGNIASGAGSKMPDLKQPPAEFTDAFWSQVAAYFESAPNVLFEICNEPADISVDEWHDSAAHLVSLIRALDVEQPLIVGGVVYASDLSWVLDQPLEDDNLAYAAHIYPMHSSYNWPHWFGEVAAQYPVLITEWGYLDAQTIDGPAYLAGSQERYGEPFLDYLDELDASWVACWYDDEWLPPMFSPGRESLNDYGQWVLEKLKD